MTLEELLTKVEELETLIQSGNDFEKADAQARELLALPQTVASHELHCRVLLALGQSLWLRGLAKEALPFVEQAVAQAEQAQNKELEAKAMGNNGNIYEILSDFPKALEYYGLSLAINEELGNQQGVANDIGNIGDVYWGLSDFPKALNYMSRALAICESLGNKKGMAKNSGNIGAVYNNLSDYPKALEYHSRALVINEELGNKRGIAHITGDIGSVYANLSDYPKALEFLSRAVASNEEFGNKEGVVVNTGRIGSVYAQLSDYPKALEYMNRSLAINEELGNKRVAANITGNIGNVYMGLSDYPKAFEYMNRSLAINEELGIKAGEAINNGNIGLLYFYLSDYPKALEYMICAMAIEEKLGNKAGMAICLSNVGLVYSTKEFEGYDPANAEENFLKAITISTEIGARHHLFTVYKSLAELYESEKRWEEAHEYFKKYIFLKDELNIEETIEQEAISKQQKEIEIERTRAHERENILNNILPLEITARLIKGENPIADHFDSVSVLFMDIVDFTPLATSITAQQLVHLLNAIFSAADGVMREFGLEKIKTIGDAYMAVAGAPIIQEDHAYRAAQAALKLLEVMENLVVIFPDNYGDKSWIESIPEIQVRIGLHCGPVAAGVVGENKFLYDLWGDAVNTASRMESHGEAGKIHVSEEFMNAIVGTGPDLSLPSPMSSISLRFVERGEMHIKGKGIMKTYFLEHL